MTKNIFITDKIRFSFMVVGRNTYTWDGVTKLNQSIHNILRDRGVSYNISDEMIITLDSIITQDAGFFIDLING